MNCDEIVSDFRKTIQNDFNFCEIDKDCKVTTGICPLGCFFIINNQKVSEVENIIKQVKTICPTCYYKCTIPPKHLYCIEKVCYPDIEEKYTAILFRGNYKKIVNLYSDYLIGKKIEKFNFHNLNLEIVSSNLIESFNEKNNQESDNLRFFVNDEGIIESISSY